MRDQGQRHLRQRGEKAWELKFDLGRDSVSGKRISDTSRSTEPNEKPKRSLIGSSIAGMKGLTLIRPR